MKCKNLQKLYENGFNVKSKYSMNLNDAFCQAHKWI